MRKRPATPKELRKFGLTMGIGLSLASTLLWWRGVEIATDAPVWPWVAGFALMVLMAALTYPHVLRPIEKVWTAIAEGIFTAITYIVLVLTYFFVITPMGLLLRILRKDVLSLKLERDKDSYWIPVEKDGPASRPFRPF